MIILPIDGLAWNPLVNIIVLRQLDQHGGAGEDHLKETFNNASFSLLMVAVDTTDCFVRQGVILQSLACFQFGYAKNNTDHNGQPDQRDEQVDSDVFKVKVVCNISSH